MKLIGKKNIQPTQTNDLSVSDICLPAELEEITRRQLLSTGISVAGYMSLAKLLAPEKAKADTSYPPQKKLVWINLNGGWDILEATDPKVGSTSGIDMIYNYSEAQALANGDGTRVGRWLTRIASHGEDVLVVRGIAMGTTSHEAGSIYMDTGILSNAGRVNAASIPSIVASESTATIPIIQLQGGSEPLTDRGLLKPVSVVRAENLALYRSMYPTQANQIERRIEMLNYLKGSVTRLQEEVGTNDRLTALSNAESKIRVQFQNNVGSKLVLTSTDTAPFTAGTTGMNRGSSDAFALVLKLLKNDLVTAVNIGVGGFDTHAGQTTRLQPIMQNLDLMVGTLIQELKTANILKDVIIVMYSDFGRTPKVNNANGRDHWPVGGALMIGGNIKGGRAVGATDSDLRALSINTTSGAADTAGTQINPTHIGGSILSMTLGSAYLTYRPYFTALELLTRQKT